MDNKKLSRRVLGEITKFNSEIKTETIEEYDDNLFKTSEPDQDNEVSIRDSIIFEEDLKRVLVDQTEVKNRITFRDSIIFKEEFPINLDMILPCQEIKQECLDMDIKPSLPLPPPPHTKSIEADLVYNKSSRNAIVFKEDLDELYEEHIIKEEIIIGPETLQPTADQRNAGKGDAELENSKLNSKQQKAKDKQIFACICGTKSSQKKWFDEHSCKKNVYVCDHCDKRCNTKFLISKNMETHQTIDRKCAGKSRASKKPKKEPKSKTQEPHTCNICNKSLTSIWNLKNHYKIHFGTAKIYKCDKCIKTFKSNEYLQYHITSIHEEGKASQMPCRYCSKIFVNRYQRNRHEKLYCRSDSQKVYVESSGKIEERPSRKEARTMTCDFCQKKYLHKQSLILHILLHMTKEPGNKNQYEKVQCDLCLKKFTKKYNLKLHIQAKHLNAKNFFCKICKKGFLRKYLLADHEKRCLTPKVCPRKVSKSDERERRFKCNLCPNKYLGKTGLRLHMEGQHLGIKHFACKYCNVTFTRKWCLNTHEKKCKASPCTF